MAKRFTDWIVRFWWLFPLVTIVFIVGSIFASDWSVVAMLIICGFSAFTLFLQLPVFVILIFKKKWWRAVGAFLLGVVCFVPFVMIPLLFVGLFFDSMPDDFGKHHPIPEGMEISIPIIDTNYKWNATDGYTFSPVDIDTADTTSWLQIWEGGQGGRYLYTLYWPALDDGEVYLKCYEATENIELSKDRMKPNTTIRVRGHNAFGQVGDLRDLVIYEGDWGDYYAARVEVWHNPTHGRKHKLMEKTYRMEGWMR